MVKENDIYTLVGVDYTSEGIGISKVDGFPIFINNLIIGEKANIKVTKVGRSFGVGQIVSFVEKSSDRITPLIKESIHLGGCQFFQLDYAKEIEYKESKINRALRVIGGLDHKVSVIHPGLKDSFYRNKTTLPLVKNKRGEVLFGMYRHNTHDVITMSQTPYDDLKASEVMNEICKLLTSYNFSIYDEKNHDGDIRKLMIRTSYYLDEIMVVLITKKRKVVNLDAFCRDLVMVLPQITTIIQNINSDRTNVNLGDEEVILHGKGYIKDKIAGLTFVISSKSFFQVNTPQAENIYLRGLELLNIQSDEVVLDAYCGIGTISLLASKHAKQVIGVEIVKEAIEDANKNKTTNKINNVSYVCDDAGEYLVNNHTNIDVVIVDPPRKGLSELFINQLLLSKPKRMLYVSCDPATLARDLKMITKDYEIQTIEAFDMFPRTNHVETIVLLKSK